MGKNFNKNIGTFFSRYRFEMVLGEEGKEKGAGLNKKMHFEHNKSESDGKAKDGANNEKK